MNFGTLSSPNRRKREDMDAARNQGKTAARRIALDKEGGALEAGHATVATPESGMEPVPEETASLEVRVDTAPQGASDTAQASEEPVSRDPLVPPPPPESVALPPSA